MSEIRTILVSRQFGLQTVSEIGFQRAPKAELFLVQIFNVIFCPKSELFRSDFGRSIKLDRLGMRKKYL